MPTVEPGGAGLPTAGTGAADPGTVGGSVTVTVGAGGDWSPPAAPAAYDRPATTDQHNASSDAGTLDPSRSRERRAALAFSLAMNRRKKNRNH